MFISNYFNLYYIYIYTCYVHIDISYIFISDADWIQGAGIKFFINTCVAHSGGGLTEINGSNRILYHLMDFHPDI